MLEAVVTPDLVVVTAAALVGTLVALAGTVADSVALEDPSAAATLEVRVASMAIAAAWVFLTAILDSRTTSLIDLSFMTDFAAMVLGIMVSAIIVFKPLASGIASVGAADGDPVGPGGIPGGDRLTTIRGGGGIRMISGSTTIITGNTRSRTR